MKDSSERIKKAVEEGYVSQGFADSWPDEAALLVKQRDIIVKLQEEKRNDSSQRPSTSDVGRAMSLGHRAGVMWAGILIFALIGLFPPWSYTLESQQADVIRPAGYAFIATPPSLKGLERAWGVQLNFARLFVQWFLVGVVTTGASLTVREKRASKGARK